MNRRSLITSGFSTLLTLLPLSSQSDQAQEDNPYGFPKSDRRRELLYAQANELITLWPKGVPGGSSQAPEFKVEEDRGNGRSAILGIHQPLLQVYLPDRPNGRSVLNFPGGAYRRLAIGPDTPRRFTAQGFTFFNLLYHLPLEGWLQGADAPLMDAIRAMRIIRREASRLHLDPSKVGLIGDSAGGHLGGLLTTRFDDSQLSSFDDLAMLSARPDYACLNFPFVTLVGEHVYETGKKNLLGQSPTLSQCESYSIQRLVRADGPPTLITHALDDREVDYENSVMLFQALRAVKVPTEIHLFEAGGHGYRNASKLGGNAKKWPDLLMDWAKSREKN